MSNAVNFTTKAQSNKGLLIIKFAKTPSKDGSTQGWIAFDTTSISIKPCVLCKTTTLFCCGLEMNKTL